MATISERINNIGSSNSSTWGTKEEEKAARSRIHDSQKGRAAWIKQQQDEENAKDNEFVEADRTAAQKRRKAQEDEISAMMAEAETTKSSADKGAKPQTGIFTKSKQEAKPKLPGFLAVKKQKTQGGPEGSVEGAAAASALAVAQQQVPKGEAVAAPAAAAATSSQEKPAAGGGIGLGAYGSSSEEEEDE